MRKCYLHIGTHKTGTTTVQHALNNRPTELASRGFLYPHTGLSVAHEGHIQVSSEVLRGACTEPPGGIIAELFDEIGRSDHHVIISSEDFTLSLRRLANLQSFIAGLQRRGLQVVVIIYFRNPADYFCSAYFETLKLGCNVPFAVFLDAMLNDEAIRWGAYESHHPFGLTDALARLSTESDVEVVVRSYDKVKTSGLVADFLSILGLTPAELGVEPDVRLNILLSPIEAFSLFYRNVMDRPPSSEEAGLIASLGDTLQGGQLGLAPWEEDMLRVKFGPMNRALQSRYGVTMPEESTAVRQNVSPEQVCKSKLRDVFSVEFAKLIADIARSRANRNDTTKSESGTAARDEIGELRADEIRSFILSRAAS